MKEKQSNFVFMIMALLISTLLLASLMNVGYAQVVDQPTLDPLSIPKYVNQLVIPPVWVPKNVFDDCGHLIRQEYKIDMVEFYQQILPPGFPQTITWGYGGFAKDAVTGKWLGYVRSSPGSTFEAIRGVTVRVKWRNLLTRQMFAVDPTIHWADPNNMGMPMEPFPPFPPGFPQAQAPVPTVVHLHGGEDRSDSDGHPEAWYTTNGIHGNAYHTLIPTSADSAVFEYPNRQMPTTLFYHDHSLGITRINVASGLAGFYLLRERNPMKDFVAPLLPKGKYEIPLAIQDRSFNTDGSMWFPSVGVNPDIHPYWQPEFFGNTIMVNGKVWPNLNVDRGQYRLRIVDASNARFYNFTFKIANTNNLIPFVQIGSDGGYIKSPVTLNWSVIAPGERADILVDFSGLAPGTNVIMTNSAPAPFPDGDPADPNTVGQIMQFTVTTNAGKPPAVLPAILNPTLTGPFPTLQCPTKIRMLPFFETMGPNGPTGIFLNGQKWAGVMTEMPRVGSTEDWWLINPTGDAHPIHLHLVQFQLRYRIPFNATAYEADWIALNGMPPVPVNTVPQTLSVIPYLTGPQVLPTPAEKAWKDTIQSPPGWVTVIRVRWAPQAARVTGLGSPKPGVNLYPFNPMVGPGYVWHCHILDHEDNEMMRPYRVKW